MGLVSLVITEELKSGGRVVFLVHECLMDKVEFIRLDMRFAGAERGKHCILVVYIQYTTKM